MIEDYESFKRTIDFLQGDMDKYRAKLNELVESCNWVAKDMPRKLREGMKELNDDNTRPAMYASSYFIENC